MGVKESNRLTDGFEIPPLKIYCDREMLIFKLPLIITIKMSLNSH